LDRAAHRRIGERPASGSDDGGLCAGEDRPQGGALARPEPYLTEGVEDVGDALTRRLDDGLVEIDEAHVRAGGEDLAHRALARPHEAHQGDVGPIAGVLLDLVSEPIHAVSSVREHVLPHELI
jgi:hypothetical protein